MTPTDPKKGRLMVPVFIAIAMIFIIALILLRPPSGQPNDDKEEEGPWKDLKTFKSIMNELDPTEFEEAVSPLDLKNVQEARKTLYILMGLERPLNGSEIVSIRDFVNAGGKVIVADDGIYGNELAHLPSSDGSNALVLTGENYLVQAMTGENDPGFTVNRSFINTQANIDGRILDLIVHEPKGITNHTTGHVILKTTKRLTVIDTNDNYVQELSDIYLPFAPISVEYNVGTNGGGIVFFSTTGLFTDSMIELKDNEQFVRSYIYTLIPNDGTVILDQSLETGGVSPHRESIDLR